MDLETAGAIVALIVGTLAILGAAWKWVILPNLREQLIKPVQDTHRHVSQNGYRDPENPTLRDEIGALRKELTAHVAEAAVDHHLLMQHLASHD